MNLDVEKVVREHIQSTVHLSLATVSGDAPWVCEVHFAYDDGLNLYFRSLKSRRHSREIDANPKVAGNIIDKHEVGDEVLGVYFEGVAELVEDDKVRKEAAELLESRLKLDEDILGEAKDPDGHQLYKLP